MMGQVMSALDQITQQLTQLGQMTDEQAKEMQAIKQTLMAYDQRIGDVEKESEEAAQQMPAMLQQMQMAQQPAQPMMTGGGGGGLPPGMLEQLMATQGGGAAPPDSASLQPQALPVG